MNINDKGTEIYIGQSLMILLDEAPESANVDNVDMKSLEKKVFKKGNMSLDDQGEYATLTDFMNHMVFVFRKARVIAFFPVYDIEHVELKIKRSLVVATGHETIHYYWLNDGEYERYYTR